MLFGSALKFDGIELLLNAMANLTKNKSYPDEFGARVYKISRDSQGNRLTHMKVTGGVLKVKDVINDEKVNQIRIYSGNKFETKDSVKAGEVCAVTGLENTRPGQGNRRSGRREYSCIRTCFDLPDYFA